MKTQKAEPRAYLDYNATSPLRPAALAAMTKVMATCWGNSSSAHTEGQGASALLEQARETIATTLHVHSSEIVFTGGGTESNNLAILGLTTGTPGHAITTAIEHPSVLNTFRLLEARGWSVTKVVCGPNGKVSVADVAKAIRKDTQLIAIMHANNETGVIQPIREVAQLAKKRGIYFHVDACQTVGRIPVLPRKLGADSLSMSAHKFGGPKGIGALYIRKALLTSLRPVTGGGSHERGMRPGTVNVPGAVGMAVAMSEAVKALPSEMKRLRALRQQFSKEIASSGPFKVIGWGTGVLPNTVCALVGEGHAEDLLVALDLKGVAVSTGAACAAGARRASHVLAAMLDPDAALRGALRFSLGHGTKPGDIKHAVKALRSIRS